ncbi:MAG: hypothetical protein FWG62_00050 [Proteobacteria bacterium]|nr:hypothetical protein [Pseudomonadota bacterium]
MNIQIVYIFSDQLVNNHQPPSSSGIVTKIFKARFRLKNLHALNKQGRIDALHLLAEVIVEGRGAQKKRKGIPTPL